MTEQQKRTVLSLAGLAVFLVLAFGSEYSTNKNSSNSNNKTIGTDARVKTTSGDIKTFSNSKSGLTGSLSENYVDFSFDYPSSWKKDPKSGVADSPNFVKVENATADEITVENFAVGYLTGPKALLPQLAAQLSDKFSPGFPEYKKVSEGETRIGAYDGYEFRFTSHVTTGKDKPIDVWGRVVLLPSDTGRKGAALIMLATSASKDVHGVDDVGEKGELPVILSSFKFGE